MTKAKHDKDLADRLHASGVRSRTAALIAGATDGRRKPGETSPRGHQGDAQGPRRCRGSRDWRTGEAIKRSQESGEDAQAECRKAKRQREERRTYQSEVWLIT